LAIIITFIGGFSADRMKRAIRGNGNVRGSGGGASLWAPPSRSIQRVMDRLA
jgi:hypothetical protein